MLLGPPVGIFRRLLHGLRRLNGEVRLLDPIGHVEERGSRRLALHLDERVRRRRLRSDAPEVERLLPEPGADEARSVGLEIRARHCARPADARHVDVRRTHVHRRRVVRRRSEELRRDAYQRQPLGPRHLRRFFLRSHPRDPREDGGLVGLGVPGSRPRGTWLARGSGGGRAARDRHRREPSPRGEGPRPTRGPLPSSPAKPWLPA